MNSVPETNRLFAGIRQLAAGRSMLLGSLVALPLVMAGCASNEYCLNRHCGEAAPVAAAPVDSDGDGVPDNLDKCPGTPAGTPVDANGCPLPAPFAFQKVYFDFDHADLNSPARKTLDDTVEVLQGHQDLSLSLQGFTDSVGTDDYNLALSQRRAVAVRDYLVSHGISSTRLEPSGYGESKPDASNDTADGRAQNRRVEFVVISR